MINGLVSIITPAYNCELYIGKAIESAQAQSYSSWEMIVVDDCSTDSTRDRVLSYAASDSRIHLISLDNNSGAAVARTEAMRVAKGQYMAFLDSDDRWKADKLSRQIEFMKRGGHAFTCTSYEMIDESDAPLGRVIPSIPKTDYRRLLLDCPVGNSTVMYDVQAMGKFEVPNIRKRNDDALWLKMLKQEQYIWGMPDILAEYRIRSGSISSKKIDLIKYHWKLYREIERIGILRSLFHIGYWGIIKILGIK